MLSDLKLKKMSQNYIQRNTLNTKSVYEKGIIRIL